MMNHSFKIDRLQMNHYCEQWIADWCEENGWTDWFQEQSSYWAFPPQAVMPTPIPMQVLKSIKAEQGLSMDEKQWCILAIVSLVSGLVLSFSTAEPIAGFLGFTVCAAIVGRLDDDALPE
jgi:hypothetical protein